MSSDELQPPGVLSARSTGAWIASLIVATLVVAAIIVWVPFGDEFNWEFAAVGATAFATIVLAAFTASLAYTTSGDVRASWQLAQIARQEQEERIRPLVVAYPSGSTAQGEDIYGFEVTVTNIGSAPALAIQVDAIHVGAGEPVHTRIDGESQPLLQPGTGGALWVRLHVPKEVSRGLNYEDYQVRGTCLDVTQRRHALLTDWVAAAAEAHKP